MKYQTTPQFEDDWRRLPTEHKKLFRAVIPDFGRACEGYLSDPGGFRWPGRLRACRMQSAPGVWELTWNFAGPDGRATFEFVTVDSQPAVRWRRVGGHAIYRQP